MDTKAQQQKTPHVIAWTGGSRPASPANVSMREAQVTKYLFAEQVATFFKYWGDYPNWDTMHTFYRRARYDAHATFRS